MSSPALKTETSASAELGRRVRSARSKIGMTRKQLSAASGASERYLAVIEAGEGNPSLSIILALAEALRLSVCELLPFSGEESSEAENSIAAVRRMGPNNFNLLLENFEHTLPAPEAKGRRVVLLGLRGAGKSSLGRELSKRRKLKFYEVSKLIEEAYGGDLSTIFELGGQAALRRYEEAVWNKLLLVNEAIIAAPGGVVADAPLFDRVLAASHTIWLSAQPEDHMSRVMEQGDFRPMDRNRSAMKDLKSILDARSPEYARADYKIDTSAQSFEDTLDILHSLVDDML